MASKTDFDRGVADRGVPSIEVPLFPLLELSKRGIKSQMQADDRPVLAVLPDGSGYVGPAWKAELVRYEMDQRMAWDRELKTGQNVSGLVGGLAHGVAKAWGGDPHAASDVGALVDATLLASYSEHTLNTQTVVNAPSNIVHGAPTYQRPLSSGKRGVPDVPIAKSPAAPRTVPVGTIEEPGAKEIKREAKELEEVVNRPLRGTSNSINSVSAAERNAQRGVAGVSAQAKKSPQAKPAGETLRSKEHPGGVRKEISKKQEPRVRRVAEALNDETKWGRVTGKDRTHLGHFYDDLIGKLSAGVRRTGDYNVLEWVDVDANLIAQLRASGKPALIVEGKLPSLGKRFDLLEINFAKNEAELLDLVAGTNARHVKKTRDYKTGLEKLLSMTVKAKEMVYANEDGVLLEVLKEVEVK